MSAVELLGMAQVLGIIAVLTVLLQLVWFRYRQRSLVSDRVRQRRLQQRTELGQELGQTRVVSGPLERLLLRADIRLSRTQLTLMGIVIFVMLALVLASSGFIAAAVVALFIMASLWLYWRFRFQQQRRAIFESLPGIMDSTLRYMGAGRSLEASLLESFQDAPPVFQPLTFRLRSAVESGRDYTPACSMILRGFIGCRHWCWYPLPCALPPASAHPFGRFCSKWLIPCVRNRNCAVSFLRPPQKPVLPQEPLRYCPWVWRCT